MGNYVMRMNRLVKGAAFVALLVNGTKPKTKAGGPSNRLPATVLKVR